MTKHESAHELVNSVADPSSFTAGPHAEVRDDPLHFVDPRKRHAERLKEAREKTGMQNGLLWGKARIDQIPTVLITNEWEFIAASLGIAEAETLVSALNTAAAERLPAIWLARGAGTSMMEGTFPLVALSRILAARNALAANHIPLITVVLDHLSAGSNICASQGDVVLALAGARIGYAGSRVVQMMDDKPLPDDFQTAEYAYANGQLDGVIKRENLRETLLRLLDLFSADEGLPAERPVRQAEPYTKHDAWECVQLSRSPDKLPVRKLLEKMADDFFELHGDRVSGDDPALFGGIARIGGQRFVVVGHRGGHKVEWKIRHNLSSPHPSGHRKAIRLVHLAERLSLPILTLIDTPGACADIRSEAEGQAGVIGQLISAMLDVSVPTISVILGEGGSSAALALASSDRVIMTDASWYSSITPEGAAAILWKDVEKKAEAAAALKLTPSDHLEAGLVDLVIPSSPRTTDFASLLRSTVLGYLHELAETGPDLARRSRAVG